MPPKVLMSSGIALAIASLLLSTQLHAGAAYWQVFVTLVLLGVGSGISLVSLTSASLAGVEPADAGAASGLVNVVQQLGAALGLAVLVNVFGQATHHEQLGAAIASRPAAQHVLTRGLDDVFAGAALFAVAALVMVLAVIRMPKAAPVVHLQSSGSHQLDEIAAADIA